MAVTVFWIAYPRKTECRISKDEFVERLHDGAERSCVALFEKCPFSDYEFGVFLVAWEGNQRYKFNASSSTAHREWRRLLSDFGLLSFIPPEKKRTKGAPYVPPCYGRVDARKYKLPSKSFDEIIADWEGHDDYICHSTRHVPRTFKELRSMSLLYFKTNKKQKQPIVAHTRYVPPMELDEERTGWSSEDDCDDR